MNPYKREVLLDNKAKKTPWRKLSAIVEGMESSERKVQHGKFMYY